MPRWFLLLTTAACTGTLDPTPPTELPWSARAISAADDRTLIVTSAGEVKTEGTEIPQPTTDDGEPQPLALPAVVDVAVGAAHACAISTTGSTHCWGDHARGALGAHRVCTPPATEGGAPDCRLGQAIMPGLPPMRDLAAGEDVTCGIMRDDAVVCWGAYGAALGGSVVPALDPPTPVRLSSGGDLRATRLIIDRRTVCAIDREQIAWCWGDGHGATPVRQPYDGVVDLAFNARHSCAITSAGLECWGENRNGESGDLDAARACSHDGPCRIEPTRIELDAVRVVVGERHSCALTAAGEVACWGSNEVGQLGRTDAFLVGGIGHALGGAIDLTAGYAHTCALRRDGTAWCWGQY